jgi:hypothetical protein
MSKFLDEAAKALRDAERELREAQGGPRDAERVLHEAERVLQGAEELLQDPQMNNDYHRGRLLARYNALIQHYNNLIAHHSHILADHDRRVAHYNHLMAVADKYAKLAEIERGPLPSQVVVVDTPSLLDGKNPVTLVSSADGLRVANGESSRHSQHEKEQLS